jgi:hypothetical protein
VGALVLASRFKRWLLADRIEQLQSSYEAASTEHQQPRRELIRKGTMKVTHLRLLKMKWMR